MTLKHNPNCDIKSTIHNKNRSYLPTQKSLLVLSMSHQIDLTQSEFCGTSSLSSSAIMTNLNCLIFLSIFLRLGSCTLLSLENRENLDQEGKVLLAWSYDEPSQVITFELEVASIGFVGFGISPTGGMGNSDMFIGGVFPNGSAYYGVRK